MSGKENYGRSSLSFNAPKGILDVDDIIESNPWKDMKTFEQGEAGQIQRVLTEFGDMLSQQKQKRQSSGGARKTEPKRKMAAKTKEAAKTTANMSGIERKLRKVGDKSYQKIGKDEGKSKQAETKRISTARRSKNAAKKNEDSDGVPIKKPRKEPEDVGNEETPVAEKKVVTRRSTMPVQKGINAAEMKKSGNVQTGDAQSKPKANANNVTKKNLKSMIPMTKSKIDDTNAKKIVKRQKKTSEKTATEKTSMKSENKDTKDRSINKSNVKTRADTDKENEKPPVKKIEKNSEVGGRKTTQRNKPPSASGRSFGKNQISPKSKESSWQMEESVSGSATERSTEVKGDGAKSAVSLEESLEILRQPIEPSAGEGNDKNANESAMNEGSTAESFYLIAEETRVIGEEAPKANSTTKEVKTEAEVGRMSSSRNDAGFGNSATGSQQQLSNCASSTLLYDSAISSCSRRNRKPRISIVATVQSDLDESLPPLQLTCNVDMKKCTKGGKLRPKITIKTPKNQVADSKDSPRNNQAKSQEKKNPEKTRKQCSKGKPRKSYQQRLEDREERREMRSARRHKRKAALAIEEFSRQVVKMAKEIGFLSGDSGSASTSSSTATTSSSPSSFDSRGSFSSDSSDSSDGSSSTCTFSSSDTSYCSCTTCLLSDSNESSGDFTEFSPCSTTSVSSDSSGTSESDEA